MRDLQADWRQARGRAVPLVAIRTRDPRATMARLSAALNGAGDETPQVCWDVVNAFSAYNETPASRGAVTSLPEMETNPAEAMRAALSLPNGSILYVETLDAGWGQQGLDGTAVAQAVRMLRDPYKRSRRTLVILGPDLDLHPLLRDDVVVLEEDLPGREELRAIVEGVQAAAVAKLREMPVLDERGTELAVDAITGLPAFAAEQAVALSIRKAGLDLEILRERQRLEVEKTAGLVFRREKLTFDGVRGYEALLGELRQRVRKQRIGCVLHLDEVEKMMAAAGTDSSGVSQDAMGFLLSEMQDLMDAERLGALILVGPAGTGKSLISSSIGGEARCPTIRLDLGGTRSRYVGDSESNIRRAWSVVKAATGDATLMVVATSNNLAVIPPELRRRFLWGIWYCDLPSPDECAALVDYYCTRYGVPKEDCPGVIGWTGAEIRQMVLNARDKGTDLRGGASTVVPVWQSSRQTIEALREQSKGRYLSASYPGTYQGPVEDAAGDVREMQF